MPFEFFDHTGDIGVSVRATTLDGLFAEAAAALAATLADPACIERRARQWVAIEAPSLDLLLVDWLNDLVFRFDADQWLVAWSSPAVTRDEDVWKLEAVIEGEPVDPARHRVKVPIKGVTYHHLAVRTTETGLEATVVFDV